VTCTPFGRLPERAVADTHAYDGENQHVSVLNRLRRGDGERNVDRIVATCLGYLVGRRTHVLPRAEVGGHGVVDLVSQLVKIQIQTRNRSLCAIYIARVDLVRLGRVAPIRCVILNEHDLHHLLESGIIGRNENLCPEIRDVDKVAADLGRTQQPDLLDLPRGEGNCAVLPEQNRLVVSKVDHRQFFLTVGNLHIRANEEFVLRTRGDPF
jgi:ribulose kinase